jgi:glucose-1-phosphate cytidylyltransferase
MKVVLLAGGYGTRLSEETAIKPKPMVLIGEKPILWHIMKIYTAYGLTDFAICCGYRGEVIKEYFASYFLNRSDITFHMRENRVEILSNHVEPWTVTLVDTGEKTMTGGRIKRMKEHIGNETFCCSYGDGVSDVNIRDLIAFHRQQRTLATLTAVQPPGRFGVFSLEPDQLNVGTFKEKPQGGSGWVNGGFFVLEPEVLGYIDDDSTVFEKEPLERLAADGQLSAYRHRGFWQNMDSLRDKMFLERYWATSKPWKVW